jgi:BRCT domain type II-containing protein
MNQYAELAQDIWPHATPEQIAVLSNALRKGFARSASPSTTSPAQSSTNVHPSKQAASSHSVAFKQQSDSTK